MWAGGKVAYPGIDPSFGLVRFRARPASDEIAVRVQGQKLGPTVWNERDLIRVDWHRLAVVSPSPGDWSPAFLACIHDRASIVARRFDESDLLVTVLGGSDPDRVPCFDQDSCQLKSVCIKQFAAALIRNFDCFRHCHPPMCILQIDRYAQ